MAIHNHNHVSYSKNNSENGNAVKQIKHIAESAGVCMFETIQPEPPFSVRPMSPVKVNDAAVLWFFSAGNSKKNKEILIDSHVQLLFSNPGKNEYLSIYGTAQIITDKKTIEEMWSPIATVWFPAGVNDPDISLIKVTPESSYYWNSEHNKMTAVISSKIPAFEHAGGDDDNNHRFVL